MIAGLAKRIGEDSVAKLERAAAWRLREANALEGMSELVAAVYLYGYVAESRIGAAYFRLIRFAPHTTITRDHRNRAVQEARKYRLMSKAPHDLLFWAELLVRKRKELSVGFPFDFEQAILRHATDVYRNWRPSLRYRATVPLRGEVRAVRQGANWFDQHYRRFWR